MSIPKRGSRHIVVDGQEYRWYVRRKQGYWQSLASHGTDLAVEAVAHRGSILVVAVPRFFPAINDGRPEDTLTPVVPGDVAQYIRLALEAGWKSDTVGSAFVLDSGVSRRVTSADSFNLVLNLSSRGMLHARVSRRGPTLRMFVSYLSDAPEELVRAVLFLLRAPGTETEVATCRWQDEPGEWRWVLHRNGSRVHIEVLRFDETYSPLPDEQGERVFQAECSVGRLAAQVQGQLQRLLNQVGEKGYQEQWGYPFPKESLRDLEQTI